MIDIKQIADNADVIVNGYAFTAESEIVRVLNLNNTNSAAVINAKGEVVETTMDDVELDIVLGIYAKSRCYMEG